MQNTQQERNEGKNQHRDKEVEGEKKVKNKNDINT